MLPLLQRVGCAVGHLYSILAQFTTSGVCPPLGTYGRMTTANKQLDYRFCPAYTACVDIYWERDSVELKSSTLWYESYTSQDAYSRSFTPPPIQGHMQTV